MSTEIWTARDVLKWTAGRFQRAGLDTARLDAELLLAHALGCDRVGLYVDLDRPLSVEERDSFRSLVTARLERRPVAYLLGRREFYSRVFEVSEAVLVPRPETELLVEAALEALAGVVRPRVLDLGTGSGVIAVTLAAERPDAVVVATDLSAAALEVAGRNVARHGVEVSLHQGDLYGALPPGEPPFQIIVGNLPYVSADDLGTLAPELHHEPREALVASADGLEVIGRSVASAPAHLVRPGGQVLLEVGAGQGDAVSRFLLEAGAREAPRVLRDLAGLDRVVGGVF